MPTFETLPIEQAMMRSATGRRAEITKEYLGYIEQLSEGEAGRLEVSEGETVATIRRRLGAAARTVSRDLVIRRVGDEVFFWAQLGGARKTRRGRPRKIANP